MGDSYATLLVGVKLAWNDVLERRTEPDPCGHEMREGDAFCAMCGAKVDRTRDVIASRFHGKLADWQREPFYLQEGARLVGEKFHRINGGDDYVWGRRIADTDATMEVPPHAIMLAIAELTPLARELGIGPVMVWIRAEGDG